VSGSDLARQGGAFVVIGLLATGVHVGSALLAKQAGLSALNANLVGYCVAVGVSYVGNARLTFRRPTRDLGQFIRFLTLSLTALGLNQALVYLLVERAHWPFWLALGPVVIMVPAISFVGSKLWAFAAR